MNLIKNYRVRGHYKLGSDYPNFPDKPVKAYSAEDAVSQIKATFGSAVICGIEPWPEYEAVELETQDATKGIVVIED